MKTKKLWMLLAVIFFIAGIGGCATTPPIRNPQISEVNLAPAYLITGVPYIRQGRNECGPTSLAMVLSFYDGKNGQKKEVVAGVMPAGKFYTPVEELENYARQRGFNTYRFCDATQNKAKIKFLVSQGYPLIVIGRIPNNWHSKRALWQGHYIVVIGYDGENFIVLDPAFRKDGVDEMTKVPYDVFKDFHNFPQFPQVVLCVYPKGRT